MTSSILCRGFKALTKPQNIGLQPVGKNRLKSGRYYLSAADEAEVPEVGQGGNPAACLSNLEQRTIRLISYARPLLLIAVTGSGSRRLSGVDRTPGQTER